jgi:predicted Zn finger-like uncharacterized protein
MYEYKCPGCKTVLRSAQPAPAGRQIKCKACGTVFIPQQKPLSLADDPPARPAVATPVKKKATPVAATPVAKERALEKEEVTGYGIIKEEDTEEQRQAKKTISFSGVHDKGKRSARGPAMSLLVFPSNLLIAEGALTVVGGILVFLWAMWPVVFVDVAPSDEEILEQAIWMGFGVMLMGWGALVCVGASKMQNLESYTWAMVGAVLGILPFLVGIFALAMLRNPKVIAGFEEIEGAIDDDEEDEESDDDDDDDEDD